MMERTKSSRQAQYSREGNRAQVATSLRIIHEEIVTRKQLQRPYSGQASLRSSMSMPEFKNLQNDIKKKHRSLARQEKQHQNDLLSLRQSLSLPEFTAVKQELKKRHRSGANNSERRRSISPKQTSSKSNSRMIPKKSPLARYKSQWSRSGGDLDGSQHSISESSLCSALSEPPISLIESKSSIEEQKENQELRRQDEENQQENMRQLADLAFLLSSKLAMAVDGGVYEGNQPEKKRRSR